MKLDTPKEHFVVMYNKDFMVSSTPHLTAMDTYVYFTMKLMAGNVYANNTVYATAAFQPIRRAIHQNAGAILSRPYAGTKQGFYSSFSAHPPGYPSKCRGQNRRENTGRARYV